MIETLKGLRIPAGLPPVYAEHASFLARRLSVSLAFLEALDAGGTRPALALAATLTDIERGYRSSLDALRERIRGLR